MAILLSITDKRNSEKSHLRTFDCNRIIIGRGPDCDICLPDLFISIIHCEIRQKEGDYFLIDTGSLNGTSRGQKRIVAHRPYKLKSIDEINIADYQIIFKSGVAQGVVPSKNEATLQARQMLASILRGDVESELKVLIINAPRQLSFRCELKQDKVYTIGNSRQAEIFVDDSSILRHHAKVYLENEKVIIETLKSQKEISFNKQSVSKVLLEPGDTACLGKVSVCYEHPMDSNLKSILNAPEEYTSSFSYVTRCKSKPQNPQQDSLELKVKEPADNFVQIDPEKKISGQLEGESSFRGKTLELPLIETPEESNDIGLIIVGVIIVLISVAVLIMLLTDGDLFSW